MAKKKCLTDIYYPVPQESLPTQSKKPPINKMVIKRIIQGTVKAAYRLDEPSLWGYQQTPIKPKRVATQEQMDMVINLIESLEPSNAIEAALASQFVISYIRGLEKAQGDHTKEIDLTLKLFNFSHQALEALQKFRSKGAQLISVNYNHNQGQINNIQVFEKDKMDDVIEFNQNE